MSTYGLFKESDDRLAMGLVILGIVIGIALLVLMVLWAAPGLVATEPIPGNRAAWLDTTDGLSRCYYSNLTGSSYGCVRLGPA